MNIVLVSSEYPPGVGSGGIGTYTYHLAHGLHRVNQQVRVVSLSPRGQFKRYDDNGVEIIRIPNAYPLRLLRHMNLTGVARILGWSLSVTRTLHWLSKEFIPDLVEAPLFDAQSVVLGFRSVTPLVVWAQTPRTVLARIDDSSRRWWALNVKAACWLERLATLQATLVIAGSQTIARTIQTDYGVSAEKIRVVHHGLSLPATKMPSMPRQGDSIIYLFVGRLTPRKGVHFLLQAIPWVVKVLPAARFVIVGEDLGDPLNHKSYRAYFEESADPAVQEVTTFLGFVGRERLEQLYAECDVFVAPSLYESFGLVHLEAMTYGKPVVAFCTGATPEVVDDGITGLLVEPGDIEGLANALIRLGQERTTREVMGDAGRHRAQTKFSVEAMVENTRAVYSEACALKRSHQG